MVASEFGSDGCIPSSSGQKLCRISRRQWLGVGRAMEFNFQFSDWINCCRWLYRCVTNLQSHALLPWLHRTQEHLLLLNEEQRLPQTSRILERGFYNFLIGRRGVSILREGTGKDLNLHFRNQSNSNDSDAGRHRWPEYHLQYGAPTPFKSESSLRQPHRHISSSVQQVPTLLPGPDLLIINEHGCEMACSPSLESNCDSANHLALEGVQETRNGQGLAVEVAQLEGQSESSLWHRKLSKSKWHWI